MTYNDLMDHMRKGGRIRKPSLPNVTVGYISSYNDFTYTTHWIEKRGTRTYEHHDEKHVGPEALGDPSDTTWEKVPTDSLGHV